MEQLSLFQADARLASSSTTWDIFVDGAARNNPGPAGAGIYIVKNGEPFLKRGFYLGSLTNNQAEYTALILALFLLDSVADRADNIHIFSDSLLMIRQLKKEYKVTKPHLKPLHRCALNYLALRNCTFNHIPREKNAVADRLANYGIDKRIAVPSEFNNFCNRL